MKWWPFRSKSGVREAEDRAYTDAIVNAIQAAAGGSAKDAGATSGLEICAGLIGRAFASAEISGPAMLNAPPAMIMESIGRDMITCGECVVFPESGTWARASSWDIMGRTADELGWRYRLEIAAPDGNYQRILNGSQVAHCRYSTDPNRPWEGVGPLQRATLAATLHSNMEQRTGEEAGANVGSVIPLPVDGQDPTVSALKSDIKNLKGQAAFVETTAGGMGQGAAASPQSDWKQMRIGAQFAPQTEGMFRASQLAVVAACGIPVELLTAADGTGQREAWRRALWGTIAPLGRLVEAQLTKVAKGPVRLSFRALMASDIASRARSYMQLKSAGMSDADAARHSGLDME